MILFYVKKVYYYININQKGNTLLRTYDYKMLFEELVSGHKLTADGGKSFIEFNPSYKNPFRHVVSKEKNIPMDELWSNIEWEHYIDIDSILVFKNWLDKEGVLEIFLKYGNTEKTKDTSPGLWLGYSSSKIFSWSDTDEGFSFWKDINAKWLATLEHHSNVESGF